MHIPSRDELLYYAQEGLGQFAGRLLVLSAKLAIKRQDAHQFAHILASLMAGNSTNCEFDLSQCTLLFDIPDQKELLTGEPMGSLGEFNIKTWLDDIE
jgi:hypothetical protein